MNTSRENSMTAMTAAFQRAGYRDPRLRLREIATEILASGRGFIAASAALLDAVRGDPALMWAMMEGQREKIALDYLRSVQEAQKESRDAAKAPVAVVEALPRSRPTNDGEAGQSSSISQRVLARPPSPVRSGEGLPTDGSRHRVALSAATPGRTKRGLASIQSVQPTMALCVLDTFRINGKPIGDNTPEEALPVAEHRETDARVIRMLCHGVPPNQRIREHINPQEAERRERLAREAPHAA